MGEAIWSETGYANAIKRNILANAFTTFKRTYPRAEEVRDYLRGYLPEESNILHSERFLEQMAINLFRIFGKLTPNQYEAICKSIDTQEERRAARSKAIEEQRARSQHLGVANERREFTVTLDKILEVEVTPYSRWDSSTLFIYLFRDTDGNRVVYKSKSILGWKEDLDGRTDFHSVKERQTVVLKATIKCHEEYKGEKQTIIQRAKVSKLIS